MENRRRGMAAKRSTGKRKRAGMKLRKLAGVVFSDLGQGAMFMSLPWVQQTLRERLGFSPYPATLNVRLDSEKEMGAWREVKRQVEAIDIPPPDASFCPA